MSKQWLWAALALCFLLNGLHAAEDAKGLQHEPLPEGKTLVQPGSRFSWKITFAYATDSNKLAVAPQLPPGVKLPPGVTWPPQPAQMSGVLEMSAPREVEVTRTGDICRVSIIDINGKKTEEWCLGNEKFWVAGDGSVIPMTDSFMQSTGGALRDYSNGYFFDMDWASADTYQGVEVVNKARCLVFSGHGMTLWVDERSRTPVCWQGMGETRNFYQGKAPVGDLTLPDNVKSSLEVVKKFNALVAKPIPRGG